MNARRDDFLTSTRWDSLDKICNDRLTEFVFNALKATKTIEFKDLFMQRNSASENRRTGDIILPRPDTNFTRNSIPYSGGRGAVAWNSLYSKELTANNLNKFKHLLNVTLQNIL